MKINTFKITVVVWFLGIAFAFSQSPKQKALEQKRQQILNEIKQINTLLFNNKEEKKSVLSQVEDLNYRLKARENLIRVTNQQANLLAREINDNLQKIESLRDELTILKEDYAAMILKSYKSKSQQSRIMFLLSSDNFLQAYKRLQYLKQYAKHRKRQGESIQQKTEELKALNVNLIAQKNTKNELIASNTKEKEALAIEKKNQEALITSLKKDEGKFAKQIRDKQKEASAIEREIDKLIKAAIAKANKAASKKTNRKAATSTKFILTPEAKALADNFTSNKGKLSWPVEKGVVTEKFGKHRHPQFPNVTINNNGVEIATETNATARAVFEGEVMQIQQIKGANKAVYIRHGNYITIYRNLATVKVKKGDKITTKQPIGTVFSNKVSGKTILKFCVYKDSNKLNPADWIYKM